MFSGQVRIVGALLVTTLAHSANVLADDHAALKGEAVAAMRRAAEYYRGEVATHGGYVYFYSEDLKTRWGEGPATDDQIWVQPPGTPTVGLAFVRGFEATGDRFYLDAATDAALALCYGQLRSGGWTNLVDFDPQSGRTAEYRNGKGRGKNNSTLDDGISQAAIRLLMQVDRAHDFKHEKIHEAVLLALRALLKAQFPNGAFPQVWTGPVASQPILQANYPSYDWRSEGRIKDYWNMYTLNDGLAGDVADVLIDAETIYGDTKYRAAMSRLGDFLVSAQMPAPQPAWAQQYNYDMQPIWARKFEPAAIAGRESEDAIATLMKIYRQTGDAKYVEPIPAALEYLSESLLADGRLARYYELQTNRPLYMQRNGKAYTLTYDDSDLPSHYGWKNNSHLKQLAREFRELHSEQPRAATYRANRVSAERVRTVIQALDRKGRWLSTRGDEPLIGQAKFVAGEKYLSSEVFSENLKTLSLFVKQTNAASVPFP